MRRQSADNSSEKLAAPTQSLLRADLNMLKLKLEKIRTNIRQEVKTKEKIKIEAISKLEMIERKEQAINNTIVKYNIEKNAMNEEKKISVDAYLKRVEILKEEHKKLTIEISDFDVLQYDNKRVKAEYAQLLEEHEYTVRENKELLNKRTEYNFDATLRFDEILRELITTLYLETKQINAVRELELDAIDARTQNEKYKEMRAQLSKEGEILSLKEKKLRDRLMDLRVDEGMARSTTEMLKLKLKTAALNISSSSDGALVQCTTPNDHLTLSHSQNKNLEPEHSLEPRASRHSEQRMAKAMRKETLRLAASLTDEAISLWKKRNNDEIAALAHNISF